MPALRHTSHSGAHKARLAAMAPGDDVEAGSLAEARSLRAAAVRLGLRVSIHRIARGQPEHRVTLCGPLLHSRPFASIRG